MTGYFLVDKKLLETFSPEEMWAMVSFQLPVLATVFIWHKDAVLADLKQWKSVLIFTFSMIGTWGLALYALKYLDATVVASLRNLSILFGVFLGAHLFDEGHRWFRYLAAILMVVGVFLVLW